MKHFLNINDLSRDELLKLLDVTSAMADINRRPVPKVPALRGKVVATVFFEDSTRTRISFDTAAKRLSADVMGFAASASSLNKGESIRDTIETLEAIGVDAFVVRHKTSGVPSAITKWTQASVINAGDGANQHPTQALLDCYTIREHYGSTDLAGLNIAIVGDIKHSRVARSNIQAFTKLGANVTLVAPSTLLPVDMHGWPVRISNSLDEVIGTIDVLYMLRLQHERMQSAFVPSISEYSDRFGLNATRVACLSPQAVVMHPGPMNRGVEMCVDPSQIANSLILRQVANGVSARMAVLFEVLGVGAIPEGEG
jgi:aspartate carbamoyltransferase catalytic subunit